MSGAWGSFSIEETFSAGAPRENEVVSITLLASERGAFAAGGIMKTTSGKTYHVKAFADNDESSISSRNAEASVLKKLDGADGSTPQLHLTGTFIDLSGKKHPCIVMDRAAGCNLYDAMSRHLLSGDSGMLPSAKQVAEFGVLLANSIAACHQRGVVHRDLWPANVYIDHTCNQMRHITLIDLGSSTTVTRSTVTAIGSGLRLARQNYGAPEVFDTNARSRIHRNETPVDVWSIGALLFYARTGQEPMGTDPLTGHEIDPSAIDCGSEAGLKRLSSIKGQQLNLLKELRKLGVQPTPADADLDQLIARCTECKPRLRIHLEDLMQELQTLVNATPVYDSCVEQKKIRERRRKLGALPKIGIALAAVFGTCLVIFGGLSLYHQLTKPQPTTQMLWEKEGWQTVVLTASDESSKEAFAADVALIESRLISAVGNDSVRLETYETSALLALPTDFGNGSLSSTLIEYVVQPVELHLSDKADSPSGIPLSRSDITSVSVENGRVEGYDTSGQNALSDNYNYLAITLEGETSDAFANASDEWSELWLVQDAETTAGHSSFGKMIDYGTPYYGAVYNSEKSTLYIIDGNQDSGMAELLAFDLVNEPLNSTVDFLISDTAGVSWDSAPDESTWQRNIDELETDDVTIELETYTSTDALGEQTKAGLELDYCNFLRAKLDTLCQPYVLGKRDDSDDTSTYFIKTACEHMGPTTINLIKASRSTDITLRSGCAEIELDNSVDSLVVNLNPGEESLSLTLDTTNESRSLAYEKLQQAVDKVGLVSLFVSETPLLIATQDSLGENGAITFTSLSGYGDITQENAWLLNLTQETWNRLDVDYGTTATSSYQASDLVNFSSLSFGEPCSYEQGSLVDDIEALYPDSTVRIDSLGAIYVSLHLDIDNSLPRSAVAACEKISQVVNLEYTQFDLLFIYLVDEDYLGGERARVHFAKWPYDYGENKLVAGGIFYGGRLEKYISSFITEASKSPLLAPGKTLDDEEWSFEPEFIGI